MDGIGSWVWILATLFILAYYYFTSTFDFWKKRGVKGPKPMAVFGNLKDVILAKTYFAVYAKQVYLDYRDEPMVGIFSRRSPILILKDPDLIKTVMIKDFNNFASRGFTMHEKVEPLSQHLFVIEPARWRPLRIKLSPVFTSGKLKEMFYLLLECSEHFGSYVEKLAAKGEPLECREITSRYTTDVIGTCAFGLNMNAMSEQESEFRRMGKKFFGTSRWKTVKRIIRDSIPWLYDLLWPIFYDWEMNGFFINSMKHTMTYREKEKIVRHDFVDLLMEIKEHPRKVGDIKMTDELIVSQALVFFVAGFETSSSTISNALYELAFNHSIQEKLREEILEEYEKNDGVLRYDSIKNMKYMHKVFQETLRKYPPVSVLTREACNDYTFRESGVTIPAGLRIWIPIYAIHHDPNIYPNPDVFDPERFDEELVKMRHPMYHLPFGDGPRNCIGARFAVYQTKIGLAKILQNFKVDVCEKTAPYVPNPAAFLLMPKDGIYLQFEKIQR